MAGLCPLQQLQIAVIIANHWQCWRVMGAILQRQAAMCEGFLGDASAQFHRRALDTKFQNDLLNSGYTAQ